MGIQLIKLSLILNVEKNSRRISPHHELQVSKSDVSNRKQ